MAVQVIDDAEGGMCRVKLLLQREVIRSVAALDPAVDFVDAQATRIDGSAIVERAPDEGLANRGLAARNVFVRPHASLDQFEIDIASVAVRIQIRTRESRCEQGCAVLSCRAVQLVDVAVLAVAQFEFRNGGVEIHREFDSLVGRIKDECAPRLRRTVERISGRRDGHGLTSGESIETASLARPAPSAKSAYRRRAWALRYTSRPSRRPFGAAASPRPSSSVGRAED